MAKRPATNDAGNGSSHKKRKTDTPERRGLPAIRAALRAAAEEEGTPLSHALDAALPSAAFFDVERHLRPLVQSVPLVLYHRSTISEILVRGIASPAVAEVIRCVEMRSALMVKTRRALHGHLTGSTASPRGRYDPCRRAGYRRPAPLCSASPNRGRHAASRSRRSHARLCRPRDSAGCSPLGVDRLARRRRRRADVGGFNCGQSQAATRTRSDARHPSG